MLTPAAGQVRELASARSGRTPALRGLVYEPPTPGPASRTLVLVHGRRTPAARLLSLFETMARRHGVRLIAPDFSPLEFSGYQRLARRGRAAESLRSLLRTALGDDHAPVDLFGFSAGAQFVHRFALVAPGEVRRYVACAAGWYTWLDPELRFPRGVADLPLAPADDRIARFLSIPRLIAVGDRDTGRAASFRTDAWLDQLQGRTRIERALAWAIHLRAEAGARGLADLSMTALLPGVAHSLKQAVRRGRLDADVAAFLYGAE